MKTLMIRYKVKKDQAAANEELVHAVFDEVRTRRRQACGTRPSGSTMASRSSTSRPWIGRRPATL